MIQTDKKVPVTSRVPESLLRQAKAQAAIRGEKLEDWITDAFRMKLDAQAFDEIRPKKFPGPVRDG